MSDLTERLVDLLDALLYQVQGNQALDMRHLGRHLGEHPKAALKDALVPFIELELLRARLDEHSRICSSCRRKLPRESGCLRGADLERQIRERDGE